MEDATRMRSDTAPSAPDAEAVHVAAGDARAVLAAMLAPAIAFDVARAAALGEAGWAALDRLAAQHRLRPLLAHERTERGADWPVPAAIDAAWRAAQRQAAMRSVQMMRSLVRASAVLAGAGIAHAALKGATLAWTHYPHPALRRMRDLDLLVEPARALEAYRLLQDAGFGVAEGFSTPPEYSLAHEKHFAPLVDAVFGVALELHYRCTDAGEGVLPLRDAGPLLARATTATIGGAAIPVLAPTDTLLHLIVHAVYDHSFDIGPLLLTDIAHLARGAAIDWAAFWDMADAGGWRRSAALCLALAERAHGALNIATPDCAPLAVPPDLGDDVFQLMLCDAEGVREMRVAIEQQTLRTARATLSFYWRRIVAPRHVVARWAGVERDHPALPGYYVLRAIALMRLQVQWRRNRHPDADDNAARLGRVERWIAG